MKKILSFIFFTVFISGCVSSYPSPNLPTCKSVPTYELKAQRDIALLAIQASNAASFFDFDEAESKIREIDHSIFKIEEAIILLGTSYESAMAKECVCVSTLMVKREPEDFMRDQQKLIQRLNEIDKSGLVEDAKKQLQRQKNMLKFYQNEGKVVVLEEDVEIRVVFRNRSIVKIKITNRSPNKIKTINMAYCKKYINSVGGEDCAWISIVKVVDQYDNKYDVKGKDLPVFKKLLPNRSIETQINTGLTVDGSILKIVFEKSSVGTNKPIEFSVLPFPR